jgi:cell division protein FtsL
MDVQFDEDRQKGTSAKTRLYSPSKTGDPTPILEDPSMPIRPQPTREPRRSRAAKKELRLTPTSKILILLSVFVIAATALFGLFGAAEYAKIISDTASVNKEIDNYNDQISQLRKTQSSMNDFSTINEVCRRLGMTMNWYKGSASGSVPAASTQEPQETSTPAPSTNEPIGDEP